MRHLLPFAALLLPSALPAQQVERFTLEGRDVAVHNLVGTLRVEGGTGDRFVVEVTRGGRDAAQLTVETGALRGRPTFRVRYPSDRITYSGSGSDWRGRTTFTVNDDGTFDSDGGSWSDRRRVTVDSRGGGLDAHANLRVLVPRGATLTVGQGVGETPIENVDGNLSVDVAASRVRASRVRGSLSLETGSGGVELSDVTGDVNVESGSGGMSVNGVRGGAMNVELGSGGLRGGSIEVPELEVEVGSGGVQLSRVNASRFRLEAGSGGSDVELLGAPQDVFVESGSGGITLRMPANVGADVDIESSSGGIQSEFEVRATRFERGELKGTIGSGGGRIRIESGSGRVRLLKS